MRKKLLISVFAITSTFLLLNSGITVMANSWNSSDNSIFATLTKNTEDEPGEKKEEDKEIPATEEPENPEEQEPEDDEKNNSKPGQGEGEGESQGNQKDSGKGKEAGEGDKDSGRGGHDSKDDKGSQKGKPKPRGPKEQPSSPPASTNVNTITQQPNPSQSEPTTPVRISEEEQAVTAEVETGENTNLDGADNESITSDDEPYSIEQLKGMDILVKVEDGNYYVLYKDEEDNVLKREISKEEAVELGYEVIEPGEPLVEDETLSNKDVSAKIKKIFGILSVTIVVIVLIIGTYLYSKQKIA